MAGPNYQDITEKEGIHLTTVEFFPVPSTRDARRSSLSHTHFLQALPNGLSIGADILERKP